MKKRKVAGFTLIEITLVLAIFAILIASLSPLIYQRVKMAKAERTIEELRGVAQAGVLYYLNYQSIPTLEDLVTKEYISIGTNPYGKFYFVEGVAGKTITSSTTVPRNAIPHTIDSAVIFDPGSGVDVLSYTQSIGYGTTGADRLRTRKRWFYVE